MTKLALYRKQIELLEIVKNKFEQQDFHGQQTGGYREAVATLFFDGKNLRDDFVEIVPVDCLNDTFRLLHLLSTVQCSIPGSDPIIGALGQEMHCSDVIKNIEKLQQMIREESNKRFSFGVFYSWQSDTDSKYNRNFIESILKKAIKGATSDGPFLSLDKDTMRVPGSPDIVNIILNKIDNAVCFVADVTPITTVREKCVPNPNVMMELGYALSTLGYERVIIVCNTAHCIIRDLPFDLGLKRVVSYQYDAATPDDEKKECEERLESQLEAHIKAIVNL